MEAIVWNVINELLIVFSLWAVIYGIGAWHLEHRGKRNIELAEETLALFYEARDTIAWIRSPIGFANEMESIERKPSEGEEEFHARQRAGTTFERYNKHKELFSKIHSLRYRFMAQIGKKKAKPFDDLNSVVREIILSARHLSILWPKKQFADEGEKERHWKKIREKEDIIWQTFSQDDPIELQLNKITLDIEKSCGDIIMAKGTLHGLLNRPPW